jgi:hypothetical protein
MVKFNFLVLLPIVLLLSTKSFGAAEEIRLAINRIGATFSTQPLLEKVLEDLYLTAKLSPRYPSGRS